MQRDDITGGKQRIQIGISHTFNILFGTAVGQHLAAEGLCDSCHPQADGSGADNTKLFAFKLKANQAVLGAALTHDLVAGNQSPLQRNHQAEHQIGHRHGGIARTVADRDVVRAAIGHVHMIHTGESDADHFKLGAVRQHLLAIFKIGKHNDIGILAAFNQRDGVLRAGVVKDRLCPVTQLFPRHGLQLLLGNAKRFQKDQLHLKTLQNYHFIYFKE
ncbi:hypothetical protein DSECCO2_652450 [anaerobic digester metagenome]